MMHSVEVKSDYNCFDDCEDCPLFLSLNLCGYEANS